MKYILGASAVLAWFALWFWIFAGDFRTHAEPVIVPHCHSPLIGMFLPCSEVDRYEYA